MQHRAVLAVNGMPTDIENGKRDHVLTLLAFYVEFFSQNQSDWNKMLKIKKFPLPRIR